MASSGSLTSGVDLIGVPRDLLAAACYCVRKVRPDGETYHRLSALSLSGKIAPFSTYPEDRAKLLDLAHKCERSDDANAIELGDLVRAILEDEAIVA